MEKCHANSTYIVRELDGSVHHVPYAGKRVKLFKKRVKFGELEDVDSEDNLEDLDQEDNLEDPQD